MRKIIFAFALLFWAVLAAAAPKVERYLLVTGANDGGKDRVKLRYAESDADGFANVLRQMGGVSQQNIISVKSSKSVDLRNAFAELEKRLSRGGGAQGDGKVRKEVLVYYSGHADEQGLKLGGETFYWADFRSAVNNLNADVKVAILDACGSGAITRTKGGIPRPAFLQDASSEMKGYAFLTSSNENEASQESDRIKGSFFTHALVSGLRGAADMTGDGKVTLNEAYQFAFNETLQNTQSTSGGTQHPNRDMNLAGTGDVVITDLREISAGLILAGEMEGRFFIRDEKGNLVAELYKNRGRDLELGLPAGKYSVQMVSPSREWQASEFALADGAKQTLSMKNMQVVSKEIAVARGDVDSIDTAIDSAHNAPFSFGFNLFEIGRKPANGVQLGLFFTMASRPFAGTQISLFDNTSLEYMSGAQISAFMNLSVGEFYGAQISPMLNIANKIDGVQASASLNIATSKFSGAQAAPINFAVGGYGMQGGAINILADSLVGGQGGVINFADALTIGQGGVINFAKDAGYAQGGVINAVGKTGVQGGVINAAWSAGMIQGGVINAAGSVGVVQGGVINAAGSVGAVQGGVINAAGSVGAVQGGIINVGGHVGRQIGLINIAGKSENTQIGLINIAGNGIIDATFYADETGRAGATLHLGSPYLYTLFDYTLIPTTSGKWKNAFPQSFGWGLGTRFGMWGNFFSLDFAVLNTDNESTGSFNVGNSDEKSNFLNKLRFGGSYKLLPGVALSSGITLNALSEGYGDDLYVEPRGDYHWHWNFGDRKVRLWPGLYAGLTVGKF